MFVTKLPFPVIGLGLYWLDIIDHYVNNYTVLIDGLLEAVAVAWVWGFIKNMRKVLLQGIWRDSWYNGCPHAIIPYRSLCPRFLFHKFNACAPVLLLCRSIINLLCGLLGLMQWPVLLL